MLRILCDYPISLRISLWIIVSLKKTNISESFNDLLDIVFINHCAKARVVVYAAIYILFTMVHHCHDKFVCSVKQNLDWVRPNVYETVNPVRGLTPHSMDWIGTANAKFVYMAVGNSYNPAVYVPRDETSNTSIASGELRMKFRFLANARYFEPCPDTAHADLHHESKNLLCRAATPLRVTHLSVSFVVIYTSPP